MAPVLVSILASTPAFLPAIEDRFDHPRTEERQAHHAGDAALAHSLQWGQLFDADVPFCKAGPPLSGADDQVGETLVAIGGGCTAAIIDQAHRLAGEAALNRDRVSE